MTSTPQQQTLFGHPVGLYTLFFAEMWERFSFYGMRAILVFYMIKDFLKYGDGQAYTVYGAYASMVYMMPFFGGMLADGLMGARRAVVLGGLLMAAGQLLLTVKSEFAFYGGLGLLIVGNGYFKPNISTIVGSLYADRSPKRDGGFTIFYMGINLGAAAAPLLCGYIGETQGWHWGFGLAAVGMLTGLAVFVLPGGIARWIIIAAAVATIAGLFTQHADDPFSTAANATVGVALFTAAVIAFIAIGRGGLPHDAGRPRHPELMDRPAFGVIRKKHAVYFGTVLMVPLLGLLVSGFAVLRADHNALVVVPDAWIERLKETETPLANIAVEVLTESSKPAALVLVLAGLGAAIYLVAKTVRLERVPRQRMFVVLILMFFIMLFFAFFEQAGSSLNNFTDRNVDRVVETGAIKTITAADVGRTIHFQPTQEQVGYHDGDERFTLNVLDDLRKRHEEDRDFEIEWKIAPDNVGMRVANREDEAPASVFQSVNPMYILVFGLILTALWGYLGARGLEPSTPFKFALGLLQLGLGFGAFWYGAECADERGMVFISWLFLGYLLHTTGELCLSPVGLSMVTKLSPRELVSTVMGSWFMATGFSQFLAAVISQFTRVDTGTATKGIPAPVETVHIYGAVFGKVAIAALISSAICFALVPLLKRWMHDDVD